MEAQQANYEQHFDHRKKRQYIQIKKVNEYEHKHKENVEKRYINQKINKTMHTRTHNM